MPVLWVKFDNEEEDLVVRPKSKIICGKTANINVNNKEEVIDDISYDYLNYKFRAYENVNNNSKEGSSCSALKRAICCLYSLDDFFCEKFASGFYADVYKVIRKKDGEAMVLKVNKETSDWRGAMREIDLMRMLPHPCVVKFEGVCVQKGIVHPLLEFANGGCLEGLIKTHPPNQLEALKIAYDVSRGMNHLHGKQVMHRDLTSKNIFIKVSGINHLTALVGDLGLSVRLDDVSVKQKLPIVGSAFWMAPECLKQLPYNHKADVFSFGVILCEMFGGTPADPDYLVRTKDFGVNFEEFLKLFGGHPSRLHPPPQPVMHLLKSCCHVDPVSRPAFSVLSVLISLLRTRFLKHSILNDIVKFSGGEHAGGGDDDDLTGDHGLTITKKILDNIWDDRVVQEQLVHVKRNFLVY